MLYTLTHAEPLFLTGSKRGEDRQELWNLPGRGVACSFSVGFCSGYGTSPVCYSRGRKINVFVHLHLIVIQFW